MIKKLDQDRNLKGYAFEYIARIMLRRQNKKNFSFLLNRFDSIDEILTKYKLQIPKQWTEFINFARIEWL